MKKSSIISRLCKCVGIFLLVESIIAFWLLLFFKRQLIIDLLYLAGNVIVAILVGVAIFAIGYIVAMIPSKKLIQRLVAKDKKLAKDKAHYEVLLKQKEKEISRLRAEVMNLQKGATKASIVRTFRSIPSGSDKAVQDKAIPSDPDKSTQESVSDAS